MYQKLALALQLGSPQVRAYIRRELPIIPILPLLIIGQLLAFFTVGIYERGDANWYSIALILASLVAIFIRRLWRWPLLLGIISMSLAVINLREQRGGRYQAIITLAEEARHGRAGRIEGIFRMVTPRDVQSLGYARCRSVYLPWRNIAAIKQGDSVLAQIEFMPIQLPLNPFSYDATLRRHGVTSTCTIVHATHVVASESGIFAYLRQQLYTVITKRFGASEQVGLYLSMVLGYRDQIGEETFRAFQRTGLAHLLVVSGYHVMLLFGVGLLVCRALSQALFPWQPNLRALLSVLACVFALLFVAFIGADGASLRAGVAVLIVTLSRGLERGRGLIHSISATLFVLLIIWPGCLFEPGVQLTFMALVGIVYGASLRFGQRWARYLAIAIAPSIMTIGITVLWFESASIVGIVLNPLLAGLCSVVVTISGLFALIVFMVGIDYEGALLSIIFAALAELRDFVTVAAELPLAYVDTQEYPTYLIGGSLLVVVFLLLISRIIDALMEAGLIICPVEGAIARSNLDR